MASGFEEFFDNNGYLTKALTRFGRAKRCKINFFNNRTYVLLNDFTRCYTNGRFDISRGRGITFNLQEAYLVPNLLSHAGSYDAMFRNVSIIINIDSSCSQTVCYAREPL